jgi:hypothetical protein
MSPSRCARRRRLGTRCIARSWAMPQPLCASAILPRQRVCLHDG